MAPAPESPRAKPWYRARNLAILAAAFLCGWIGLEVYRSLTARPGTPIDYAAQVRDLMRAAQPAGIAHDDPNGWELLQQAIVVSDGVTAEIRSRPESPGFIDYSLLYSNVGFDVQGYNEDEQARIRADARDALALLRKGGAFEALAKVSETPFALRPGPTQGPLVQFMLPDLGKSRNLARAGAGRMFLAAEAGDGPALARAYEDNLALGRICTQQAFLIEHLVGYAIVGLANAELARNLIERRWDEETLRACLAAIDRQRRWMGSLEIALRCEHLSVLDSIQWTHTDDGRGSGRLIMTALTQYTGGTGLPAGGGGSWLDAIFQYRIGNLAGIVYPSRRATTRKTNEYFENVLRFYRATPAERARMQFHPDTAVEGMSPRHIVLRLLLPGLGKSMQSEVQHTMGIEGMRLMLAIEIHRARHDAYPASLSALAPDVLPEIPQDPLGTPFGYRVLAPGEDPDGRGYVLYSFGRDLEDNEGRINPTSPWAAMHHQTGVGYDFVINMAREKIPDAQPPSPPDPVPPDEPGEFSNPSTGP